MRKHSHCTHACSHTASQLPTDPWLLGAHTATGSHPDTPTALARCERAPTHTTPHLLLCEWAPVQTPGTSPGAGVARWGGAQQKEGIESSRNVGAGDSPTNGPEAGCTVPFPADTAHLQPGPGLGCESSCSPVGRTRALRPPCRLCLLWHVPGPPLSDAKPGRCQAEQQSLGGAHPRPQERSHRAESEGGADSDLRVGGHRVLTHVQTKPRRHLSPRESELSSSCHYSPAVHVSSPGAQTPCEASGTRAPHCRVCALERQPRLCWSHVHSANVYLSQLGRL